MKVKVHVTDQEMGGWVVGCVDTDTVEYLDCVFRRMHRSMEGGGIVTFRMK